MRRVVLWRKRICHAARSFYTQPHACRVRIHGTMTPHFVLPQRFEQRAIGLALACAIAGSWLAIHAWGMFVFELTWSNWPLALAVAMVQCWLSVGVFIVCMMRCTARWCRATRASIAPSERCCWRCMRLCLEASA